MGKKTTDKLLKLIISILLPPLGAFLQVGVSLHFWINLVLCLMFWLPGVLHAVWLVLTNKRG